jgi:hypothetical protein
MAKSKAQRLQEAVDKIDEGLNLLSDIASEVVESRDNMSGTNLENTERYQRYDEAADTLSQAVDDISNAKDEAAAVEI